MSDSIKHSKYLEMFPEGDVRREALEMRTKFASSR